MSFSLKYFFFISFIISQSTGIFSTPINNPFIKGVLSPIKKNGCFFISSREILLLGFVVRILLIPVISGISYELIRLAGRTNFFLIRLISAPGLWLQRLTTKEPDEDMIEVAIKSVEAVFDWKAYLKDSFGYEIDDSWLRDDEDETDELKSAN